MGKTAERQIARRNDVVQAALRVIARDGLENASFRAIAAELGSTIGVLTHHFPNREALMRMVLETVSEGISQAFESHANIRTLEDFEALAAELLPLDAGSRSLWKIWLSFAVASNAVADLAQNHGERYAGMIAAFAETMKRLQVAGVLLPRIDAQAEAEALVCLIDGIGMHGVLMSKRMTPARQRAILHGFLASIAAQT